MARPFSPAAGMGIMAGWGGRDLWFQRLGGKSVISLTEWKTPRVIPPRMAESGVMRQDAARLRPVQFSNAYPIPLEKSDLQTGAETKDPCRPTQP